MYVLGEHVGWIWIQNIDKRPTYIELKGETFFRVFVIDNIQRHFKKRRYYKYEDVKLGMVKNDKVGLRYLDLNGIKKR